MILINVIAILLALVQLSVGTGFGSVWPKTVITTIYQLCLNPRTVCFYEPDQCLTAGESSCQQIIVLSNYQFAHDLLNHDNPHNSVKSDQIGLFLFDKVDSMNRDDRSVVAALTQESVGKKQHNIYHIHKCELTKLNHIDQVSYLIDKLFTNRTAQRSVSVDVTKFTSADYFGCSWTYSYSDIMKAFSTSDLQVLAVDSLTVRHNSDVKITSHRKGRAHVASDGFISATEKEKTPVWAIVLAFLIVATVLGAFIHSGIKRLCRWRQLKNGQVLSNVAMPVHVLPQAGPSVVTYAAAQLMPAPSLTTMTAMPAMTLNTYPPDTVPPGPAQPGLAQPSSPYMGAAYPAPPSAPMFSKT